MGSRDARCHQVWDGPCPPGIAGIGAAAYHVCARPPLHADGCTCYCGAKRDELGPVSGVPYHRGPYPPAQ